ncbi:NAD(P)H-hydrate epimerase [Neisseria sp. HSC-16F19]|nr:NAD(P)H-hydrate epimerase [Neisseria sp. HSC-16F19]MCP2040194.1 NAD(P)H-hydrate epimerase [Neisseria sp. HSC-16F19]
MMGATVEYSIAEMRAWEDAAVAAGGSYAGLMENAGARAAAALAVRCGTPQRTLVLCGHGNNGGDGWVLARHLAARGWPVLACLLTAGAASPLNRDNHAALPSQVAQVADPLLWLPECSVVVDAVFGTGFDGDLPPAVARVFQAANAATHSLRVALDIPSGVHGDSGRAAPHSFAAALTYTFQARKPAHRLAAAQCGEVVCINIE